ncbi:putative base excision dna repair protein [Erysiphe necator]|uniref:Putative base excision dna repair protein n=1 Tax=Uncinula necator TaxID=52586 RepID=A0A0B1P2L8_UNCNE|nr:putative base excision dna repair protein [Erysiphe necator]
MPPGRKRRHQVIVNKEHDSKKSVKLGVVKELKIEKSDVEHQGTLASKLLPKNPGNDLISRKLSSHVRYQNVTPFPDFVHPTAAECKLAHQILASLHGVRSRPSEIKAPKSRAGCGDSPSVLDALVRTILSQNTNGKNSTRAKLCMDEVYGKCDNWKAIVAGGQSKLQETIKCGGLSANKSRAILGILNQVYEKYNTYSLNHLHKKSNDEAMQELLSFPGVGPKTASCVLLFCLQRESFAVDTHVWRLSGLLGWRPEKATRDETFRHLDQRIPDEDKYGLHILLIAHGKVCPECRAGGKYLNQCLLRKAFPSKNNGEDAIEEELEKVKIEIKKEDEGEGQTLNLKLEIKEDDDIKPNLGNEIKLKMNSNEMDKLATSNIRKKSHKRRRSKIN